MKLRERYSTVLWLTAHQTHHIQNTCTFQCRNVWKICERFLDMEACEKKEGCENIAELIRKVLEKHDIQLKNCRGQ